MVNGALGSPGPSDHPDGKGRILFLVPDFEPAMGGTTRQTGNQARALARRGHRVSVLTRRLEDRWPRHEVLDELPVDRVGRPGRSALTDKASVALMAERLRRVRSEIRVVQVVMYADFALSAAAVRLLPRTVITWAALGDATDLLDRSGRLGAVLAAVRGSAFRRCRHVALTSSIAAELTTLGIADDPEIIPVPIDLSVFRPATSDERAAGRRTLGAAPEETVIAYTGHLRALKGLDRLLEAFAGLVASGRRARLVLAGGSRGADDDCEKALRERAARRDIAGLVTFSGVTDDVRPWLWAADAFVLPSFREGLPNSLLEAMACGLPCVAPPSAAGNNVLYGGAGLVPSSNEPSDLATALTALADDDGLRRRLSDTALERVKTYDVEEVATSYERLYERVDSAR